MLRVLVLLALLVWAASAQDDFNKEGFVIADLPSFSLAPPPPPLYSEIELVIHTTQKDAAAGGRRAGIARVAELKLYDANGVPVPPPRSPASDPRAAPMLDGDTATVGELVFAPAATSLESASVRWSLSQSYPNATGASVASFELVFDPAGPADDPRIPASWSLWGRVSVPSIVHLPSRHDAVDLHGTWTKIQTVVTTSPLATTICTPSHCSNGGVCSVETYAPRLLPTPTPVCDCPLGFTGSTCETPASPANPSCAVSGCNSASGTCVAAPSANAYVCSCAAGFSGSDCSVADVTAPNGPLPGSLASETSTTLDIVYPEALDLAQHVGSAGMPIFTLSFPGATPPLPPLNLTGWGGGVLWSSDTANTLQLVVPSLRGWILHGTLPGGSAVVAEWDGAAVVDRAGNVGSGSHSVTWIVANVSCGVLPTGTGGEWDCGTPSPTSSSACFLRCPQGTAPSPEVSISCPSTPTPSWGPVVPSCVGVPKPTLLSVSPGPLVSAVSLPATFTFTGVGLGNSANELVNVTVGGDPCGSLTYISDTSFSCVVSHPGGPGSKARFVSEVVVTTRNFPFTSTSFYVGGYTGAELTPPLTGSRIASALAAVIADSDPDHDTLVLPPGYYTGCGVTFSGSMGAKSVAIVGHPNDRPFWDCGGGGGFGFKADIPGLTISFLHIAKWYYKNAYAPVQVLAPNTVLEHVMMSEGKRSSVGYGQGGCLYVGPLASGTVLRNVTFFDCVAVKEGGCAYIDAPDVVLDKVYAHQCQSFDTRGGAFYITSNAKRTLIRDSKTYKMGSPFGGAHIYVEDGAPLTVERTHLWQGTSNGNGGCIRLGELGSGDGTHSVTDSLLEACTCSADGGGIHARPARTVFVNNTFYNSQTVGYGGCLLLQGHHSSFFAHTAYDNFFLGCKAVLGGGLALVHATKVPSMASGSSTIIHDNYYSKCIGSFGGGVLVDIAYSDTTLTNEVFHQNAAGILGAGMYIGSLTQNVAIANAMFLDNFSIQNAGGLYVDIKGEGLVRDSVFRANSAMAQGGAISSTFATYVILNNVTIQGNVAGAHGGAIASTGVLDLSLTNCLLEDNRARTSGGAISAQETVATVTGVEFVRNSASADGGAVSSSKDSRILVTSSAFTDNYGGRGGAVFSLRGEYRDCVFRQNSAATYGGAVFAEDPALRALTPVPLLLSKYITQIRPVDNLNNGVNFTDCVFEENMAGLGGGAVAANVRTAGPPHVFSGVFTNNSATEQLSRGGAFFALPGSRGAGCHGCVFGGNRAGGSGGSVALEPDSEVLLFGTTRMETGHALSGGCLYVASGAVLSSDDDVDLVGCTASERGGGALLMGSLLLSSTATFEVANCASGSLGGGLVLESNGAFVSSGFVLLRKNTADTSGGGLVVVGVVGGFNVTGVGSEARTVVAENVAKGGGGGGLYICSLECGLTGVELSRVAPLVESLSLIRNSGLYGANLGSSPAALTWVDAPVLNVTLGTVITSRGGTTPSVVVADMFGSAVVRPASTLRAASVAIVGGGLSGSGDDLRISGVVSHVIQSSGTANVPDAYVIAGLGYLSEATLGNEYVLEVTTEVPVVDGEGGGTAKLVAQAPLAVYGCAPGTYSSQTRLGMKTCSPCAPGFTSDGGIDAVCRECEPGTHGPTDGTPQCEPCAAGTFSQSAGASVCAACVSGQWSFSGSTGCSECPTGGSCEFGTLTPKAGWYAGAVATKFYKCPNPDACVDGGCAANYEGPLCDACVRDGADGKVYAKVGRECSACPSQTESYILIGIGALGVGIIGVFFISGATSAKSTVSILFKIVLDYLQLLSLTGELVSQAGTRVTQFFNFTRTATTSVNVFPIRCIWPYHYYNVFLFYLLVPPVAVVIVIGAFWTVWVVGSRTAARTTQYRNRAISALTVVFFLAYPSVVKHLFQVFSCHRELRVLKVDVRIPCYDAEHVMYSLIGAAALALYAGAIPLWWFMYLRRARENGLLVVHENRATVTPSLARFMFLIDGYRPEFVYWEIVTVLRKTVVVIVLVFASDTAHTQSLFALVVLYGFATAHLHLKPYAAAELNRVEAAALGVLLINVLGSLAFVSDEASGDMSVESEVTLITLNVLFLVGAIAYGAIIAWRMWKGSHVRVGGFDVMEASDDGSASVPSWAASKSVAMVTVGDADSTVSSGTSSLSRFDSSESTDDGAGSGMSRSSMSRRRTPVVLPLNNRGDIDDF